MLSGCIDDIYEKLIIIPEFEAKINPPFNAGDVHALISQFIPPQFLRVKRASIELAANSYVKLRVYRRDTLEDVTDSVVLNSCDTKKIDVDGTTLIIKNTVSRGPITITTVNRKNLLERGNLFVTISLLPICGNGLMRGNGIDDRSKVNAQGACLKVVKDDDDNLFTSTPSMTVINTLNPAPKIASQQTNSKNEFVKGPEGLYATMSQGSEWINGEFVNSSGGADSQFEKWCKRLADIRFANRSNWKRPTKSEMEKLSSDKPASLWSGFDVAHKTGYGWPALVPYWTVDIKTNKHFQLWDFSAGMSTIANARPPRSKADEDEDRDTIENGVLVAYASCVSIAVK